MTLHHHTALAVAGICCALSAAHAQSANTIYGLLDVGVSHVGNNGGGSRTAMDSGIWQSSRIGFRGTEDLGSGMSALYLLEAGVNVDTGAGSAAGALAFNRQSYVGLSSHWGTLTFGRQYDFLYVTSLPLSSELFAGGLAAGTAGGPGGSAGSTNILDVHFGGTRYDNSIKWVKPIGPVTVGLMHGYGQEGAVTADTKSVNSALLSYKDGPLSIGLAWAKDDFNAANSGNTANRVGAVKALYKLGSVTFIGSYADGSSRNSKATNKPLELGMAYSPMANTTVGIAWGRAQVTNAVGAGTQVQQVTLGANYNLSKRTVLYAMLANNRSANAVVYRGFVGAPGGATAPSSDASQSVVRLGMTHFF